MVLLPASGKYCLGYSVRDSGQRRVPEPPERITGINLNNVHSSVGFVLIFLDSKSNNDNIIVTVNGPLLLIKFA